MSRATTCCWRRSRWRRSRTVTVRRGDRVDRPARRSRRWKAATRALRLPRPRRRCRRREAQLADLKLGRRPEEIAVLEATLTFGPGAGRRGEPRARRARSDLFKRGIATQAQLDEASTRVEVADAAIGQAEANLAVAGAAGARRDDQGRREPGAAGAGQARPGAAGGSASARSSRPRRAASTT